jgi:hypothetical protein
VYVCMQGSGVGGGGGSKEPLSNAYCGQNNTANVTQSVNWSCPRIRSYIVASRKLCMLKMSMTEIAPFARLFFAPVTKRPELWNYISLHTTSKASIIGMIG